MFPGHSDCVAVVIVCFCDCLWSEVVLPPPPLSRKLIGGGGGGITVYVLEQSLNIVSFSIISSSGSDKVELPLAVIRLPILSYFRRFVDGCWYVICVFVQMVRN